MKSLVWSGRVPEGKGVDVGDTRARAVVFFGLSSGTNGLPTL